MAEQNRQGTLRNKNKLKNVGKHVSKMYKKQGQLSTRVKVLEDNSLKNEEKDSRIKFLEQQNRMLVQQLRAYNIFVDLQNGNHQGHQPDQQPMQDNDNQQQQNQP
jgi:hypothetical protein